MSKFKLNDFQINSEPIKKQDIQINSLDQQSKLVIREFEFQNFKKQEEKSYHENKKKFGPLAVTDEERAERLQKDRRFSLNPLIREPLSVEQEERRVMEEKVRSRIQAIAEDAKKQAFEVGHAAGLKKGYEEAYRAFQIEGADRIKKFEDLLKEAENAKNEIFRANEKFLVELFYRIARVVLLKEISIDKEYVLRLAKELISRLGVKENITIKISPEDAKTSAMLKEGIEKSFGQMANLNIEIDSSVSRGGCKVETELSTLDATIETQLEGIQNALLGTSSKV